MKQADILFWLRQLAMPVIIMLLGAILLVYPDSAAIVIATLLSYILLLGGICYGAYGILGPNSRRTTRLITAAFCLMLGSALLANPLLLARNLGRVLGLILAIEGAENLFKHSVSKTMAILTLAGAVVLLLAPMTASRLVFSLCGLILLVIGIAQLLERLRRRRIGRGNDDPNIIDAL